MIEAYSYFFELPLYTKIKFTTVADFKQLMTGGYNIDAYSPTLKENTTYRISSTAIGDYMYLNTYKGYYNQKVTCVRDSTTHYVYSYFDGEYLQKVGQHLSIADFHISKIKNYSNVLSKESIKEFTRAIGLAANGVGIGSFVYLRRIFETLLEEAHKSAMADAGWDDEAYKNNRVSEKIDMLKNHLPSFLVENRKLYGILSKGIHSLTEDECLQSFEIVKVGIEFILDEKVELVEKQKKIEEAKKRIAGFNK